MWLYSDLPQEKEGRTFNRVDLHFLRPLYFTVREEEEEEERKEEKRRGFRFIQPDINKLRASFHEI